MNKLTTTLLTILLLTSSAIAKIGETAEQIIKTAQRDKDAISSHAYTWEGKDALNITYKDGSVIRHLFGSNKREIAFYLFSAKRLSGIDITKIQRQFHTKWYSDEKSTNGVFFWLSENRKLGMAAQRQEKFDYLCIFDLTKKSEIPGDSKETTQTPTPDSSASPTGEKDCLIVATDALSRLKGHASWARIAGFMVTKKSEKTGSHAVVFFQPTETSQIYMYDKSGSMELPTTSHDLEEVIAALNQVVGKADFNIQDPKWIGEEASPTPESKEYKY